MSQIHVKINDFSEELRKALGIANLVKTKLAYGEIQWHTPNFTIYLISRLQSGIGYGSWRDVLEVCPRYDRNLKLLYTWSIKEHLPTPSQWHYKFSGTSTENLPPKYYQELILEEIKNTELQVFWDKGEDQPPLIYYEPDEEIESRFDILDL